MTAFLLSALFASGAVAATLSIVSALRQYGRTALALRGELSNAIQFQEIRVTVTDLVVTPKARILRPEFRRRALRQALADDVLAAA